MPLSHINKFSFLVPGNYTDDDPFSGLEETLQLFEQGESLGYHTALVRQRHLERGVSSAATFLAAASQRTTTIGLGTAVIQLGYENPFRLAEDLATVDVLSRGRLNIGVSVGPPPFAHLISQFTDRIEDADYSHKRAERLAEALRSNPLSDDAVAGNAAGSQQPRVRPYAKGLSQRLWYGGGSLSSAKWAGEAGFNLLTGNIISGEGTDDFHTAQAALIHRFRSSWSRTYPARVALGRVILPTDSAGPTTRRRYREFVEERNKRTGQAHGPRRTLFLADIVGTTDEILEILANDPVIPLVSELRLELPYEFRADDYRQIIQDFSRVFANSKGESILKKGSG
ncbi:alkanesulfonate monooxygenase SsuD/methylene tetrahydromethanopterin reductase-like flavin-dependent oxidoreductase (luciferase family) [Agrobacterium larrymoorei]|uniref:Alkanesulfonate monooxygenase SsuD/methylene tetrahydromethanopterin reductase-like flavin-dependent oxidoreductase (Luciferase family) n=1 Tax=Agrobacterium larrymoorei TaxID=160699 RepID=A0AAJ2EPX3_9HYPH|nr:LLM class flavin-dependent oxidoreductase [Agrobacterium larrymoorei]MDR6099924.1 alkanesulfonate monooxygenase SsuD/methylene tetrahydromethanopterin reductase-like flavin-dependent oxidoreductase (luciferase family) [Agrobacterium larrymoorei]